MSEVNSVSSLDDDLSREPIPSRQMGLKSSLSPSSSMSSNLSLLATQSSPKTPTPITGAKTLGGGDRFIPNRGTSNFELGHLLLGQANSKEKSQEDGQKKNSSRTPFKAEYQKLLSEALQVGDIPSTRILCYKNKASALPGSHGNPHNVAYSMKTPDPTEATSRSIPSKAERILYAPNFSDDYYLNLLDWSSDNIIAVGIGHAVCLWNTAKSRFEVLVEFKDHLCALPWAQKGSILAIGTIDGTVELWDCAKMKRLRRMVGHSTRVAALAWNSFLVSSGSQDGSIVHHDVRARNHKVSTLTGHTEEVCGLKWSTDFKYRALAWCPWQSNVLASGGGTDDRSIKFWNCNNGLLLNSVDTQSQVWALLWSSTHKELISAHGFSKNQLIIWKYPSMVKQAELSEHTSRVLHLAMSPNGSSVISGGADKTLRLWNCFAPDPRMAKKAGSAGTKARQSIFRQTIR